MASYDGFTYKTNDPIFYLHITNGCSEPYPRELELVKRYQQIYPTKKNLFIDVGGHIGTCSLPYSRLFQKVIAYEPNKENFHFFMNNMEENNCQNITVHNKGLYYKNTECIVVPHDGGNSGCFYIKENPSYPNAIKVAKLDDELASNTMPVDFIKIDTEGSELFVLWGASETIRKWKPLIQIETNGQAQKNFGYPDSLCERFLEGFGYKVFDTDGNNPLFYCP
jgi:FkbM family methyltransferase